MLSVSEARRIGAKLLWRSQAVISDTPSCCECRAGRRREMETFYVGAKGRQSSSISPAVDDAPALLALSA